MALLFKVSEVKNTLPNAKRSTYAVARAKQLSQISTKELAASISNRCTLHRSDIVAVLDALGEVAVEFLMMGYGVKLGELGSIYTTLKSKTTDRKEDFVVKNIKQVMIRYTPSVSVRRKLDDISFMDADEYVATTLRPKVGEDAPGSESAAGKEPQGGEERRDSEESRGSDAAPLPPSGDASDSFA